MKFLLENIRSLTTYKNLLFDLNRGQQIHGLGLPRAVRLPVLASLHADLHRPIILITDRADHALALYEELAFWIGDKSRYIFSEPNPLFYENAAWGNSTQRERLQAITALSKYHLPDGKGPIIPPIIIASARAIMTRTLPCQDFLQAAKQLRINQKISQKWLLDEWLRIGYQVTDTVLETGQFSHRGGLIDIWPPAESLPIRLDFFGDQIDSIRQFNPSSQRTIAQLDEIIITPSREYLLPYSDSSDEIYSFKNTQENISSYSEFYIPILYKHISSLLDYLPPKALALVDDFSILESVITGFEEQAIKLRSESIAEGILSADFPVPYLSWSELLDDLQNHTCLELGRSSAEVSSLPGREEVIDLENNLSAQFGHIERFGGRLKSFFEYLNKVSNEKKSAVVVSRQSSRLEGLWIEQHHQSSTSKPQFVEASISEGWSLGELLLITDSEVFGWERPQLRQRPRPRVETPEAAYADFQPENWVVHVDYGIGRYLGLFKRSLEGVEREFLCVEYKNGDQVFVPIYQADRLTRYIGPDAAPPALGHLGGQEWSDSKRRVQEAVQNVAQELLDLYAHRQIAEGFAFSADTAWQGELESSFPYIETEDQIKALAEIKADMESKRPMDRLLCGDVGYGKTEVALRSAFKAVMSGKQVALLVPTTVLAQQHYDTFRQRLAAFPVTVEMLSRFRSTREQNQIIYGLAEGAIDIIIGTHRLIQPDVTFKDLCLVIIDEEQRFGVTHKEHLKKLRTATDVLTLTATPIPRTLYMALTSVRDISNLNTPPEERLPIVTHIGPYSPKLVRQAVLRELERGGQIYFVHNRVQSINAMRMHLVKLIPEAQIAIAHGQMPEHDLASVMHRFTAREIDLLLTTSIIESGLDIPNANTLIVDRADTFGLAQLYQLRGRVGRGAVRAYCYFFRHKKLPPTLQGQERLEVIAENTQLGAGYSIAMRDLEMRGAGELLGIRQSGHIASVGFHLYTRLLADAVRRLRVAHFDLKVGERMQLAGFDTHLSNPINVDLPLTSGIPVDYVSDQALRLRLYRRLADVTDEAELEALADEFTDRFGQLPEMVKNLFYQMQVKMLAEKAGLVSIGLEGSQIVLRYPQSTDHAQTPRLPDLSPGVRGGRNAYWCTFGKDLNWKERLLETLNQLKK